MLPLLGAFIAQLNPARAQLSTLDADPSAFQVGPEEGWCGPDTAVLGGQVEFYPACIQACISDNSCGAVRWLKDSSQCERMSACVEKEVNQGWGHWVKQADAAETDITGSQRSVVMSERGPVHTYTTPASSSQPLPTPTLPFRTCNLALCEHGMCPGKVDDCEAGTQCVMRLDCTAENPALLKPGDHYINCPDQHFGDNEWQGPTTSALEATRGSDLQTPAWTAKTADTSAVKTLRNFQFFNVNPDNYGGGRCENLVHELKNGQYALDSDVQIANTRCFPGPNDEARLNSLNTMVCNKLHVAHPDDTPTNVGMLLFKRTRCTRADKVSDWECSNYKISACYKCKNHVFNSHRLFKMQPGDQINFLINCREPVRCSGRDEVIARQTTIGF